MSAMLGNGQCESTILYDEVTHRCILPKGHLDNGFPHSSAWWNGHQHKWIEGAAEPDTAIRSKEGQVVIDIGDV